MEMKKNPRKGMDIGKAISDEFTAVTLHAVERGLADGNLETLISALKARIDIRNGVEPRRVRKSVIVASRLKELREELLEEADQMVSNTSFDAESSERDLVEKTLNDSVKSATEAQHTWVRDLYGSANDPTVHNNRKILAPGSIKFARRGSIVGPVEFNGNLYEGKVMLGEYAVTTKTTHQISAGMICKIFAIHNPVITYDNSSLEVLIVGTTDPAKSKGLMPAIENRHVVTVDAEAFGDLFAV